jgi:hypothetical protein
MNKQFVNSLRRTKQTEQSKTAGSQRETGTRRPKKTSHKAPRERLNYAKEPLHLDFCVGVCWLVKLLSHGGFFFPLNSLCAPSSYRSVGDNSQKV